MIFDAMLRIHVQCHGLHMIFDAMLRTHVQCHGLGFYRKVLCGWLSDISKGCLSLSSRQVVLLQPQLESPLAMPVSLRPLLEPPHTFFKYLVPF